MLKIRKCAVTCVQLNLKYFCIFVHCFGYSCNNYVLIGIISVSIASHELSSCACVRQLYLISILVAIVDLRHQSLHHWIPLAHLL